MKRSFLFMLSLSVGIYLQSCNASKEDATVFNNKLVSYDATVMESIRNFQNALAQYDSAAIVNYYAEAKAQIVAYHDSVKAVEAVNGGSDLQLALLKKYEGYQDLLNNDYKKLIELFNIPNSNFGEQQKKEWDMILESSAAKQDSLYALYTSAQEAFAKKFDILK